MGVVVLIIVVVFVVIVALSRKGQRRPPAPSRPAAGRAPRATRPPTRTSARARSASARPEAARPGWLPPVTTPTAHDPAQLAAAGDAVWVPAGQLVTVSGFTIPGGLLYVGQQLTGAATREPDPALIDSRLTADSRAPDYGGALLGYWPSYSELKPTSRAAYLHWLADGRQAPEAPIGYVFLYFYGLERRLLVDAQHSTAAQAEYPTLIREVQRLLDRYGDNHSLRGYAERLLAAAVPIGGPPRYLKPPPAERVGWELPLELRLGLGQLIADSRPIPADWALAWLRLHPESYLRTPATRCPAEFAEVFTRLYTRRFGDGMRLRPNRTTLGGTYRPASSGFAGQTVQISSELPDVAALSAPMTQLRELASDACTELDAYSRYLGRHPDAAGTPAAQALLPADLDRPANPATQALIGWVTTELGEAAQATVTGGELLSRWPSTAGGKLPKADAVLLGQLLDRHGVGLEPDVRFGGAVPVASTRVVLFRHVGTPVTAPGGHYTAAAALTGLAAVIAAADGGAAEVETRVLTSHLGSAFDLVADEQARLGAHLTHVLTHPPTPAKLRKRAAALSAEQRRAAASLMIAVAAADGVVTPEEVGALTRVFTALGLDPASVYSEVHALAAGSCDDLTTVRTAGTPAATFPLPPAPAPEGTARRPVILDKGLIAARLAESARAAAVLAEIFIDEEPTPAAATAPASDAAPAAPAITPPAVSVAGLDPAHAALLQRLATQPGWTRAEFETVTAELALLPDGALDTLNEAAVDTAGEPVCEGSDPIEINSYALQEMLR